MKNPFEDGPKRTREEIKAYIAEHDPEEIEALANGTEEVERGITRVPMVGELSDEEYEKEFQKMAREVLEESNGKK